VNDSPTTSEAPAHCWQDAGAFGSNACAKIQAYGHCYDCPTYARYGRRLLDRKPEAQYLEEWSASLAQQELAEQTETESVVVFRIASEWFALPTALVKSVAPGARPHSIPHRSDPALLGLVNVLGALHLCVSLHALLEIPDDAQPAATEVGGSLRRMLVVGEDADVWVFPVDDVHGIFRYGPDQVRPPPPTVAKATTTYTKSLILWNDTHVACINYGLLFASLRRRVQ